MRDTEVYGGNYAGKYRMIVQARSGAEARRKLAASGIHIGRAEWNRFWGVTRNAQEMEVAGNGACKGPLVKCVTCNGHGYQKWSDIARLRVQEQGR